MELLEKNVGIGGTHASFTFLPNMVVCRVSQDNVLLEIHQDGFPAIDVNDYCC